MLAAGSTLMAPLVNATSTWEPSAKTMGTQVPLVQDTVLAAPAMAVKPPPTSMLAVAPMDTPVGLMRCTLMAPAPLVDVMVPSMTDTEPVLSTL